MPWSEALIYESGAGGEQQLLADASVMARLILLKALRNANSETELNTRGSIDTVVRQALPPATSAVMKARFRLLHAWTLYGQGRLSEAYRWLELEGDPSPAAEQQNDIQVLLRARCNQELGFQHRADELYEEVGSRGRAHRVDGSVCPTLFKRSVVVHE